jgi:flagellar hook-associated protein 3 FlgL
MTNSISSLSIQLKSISSLQSQQSVLAKLGEQLASGAKHNDLTDYDPNVAHNLLNFQNSVTQKQAYLASMTNVQTRLTLYDQTLGDIEKIAANAGSLASSNQNLDPSKVSQLQAQAQTFLQQLTDDLNQQVGGRYLFAGTRYSTQPVQDLTTVSGIPTYPLTLVQSSDTPANLPTYDSQYSASTLSTTAWVKDSVTVDDSFSVQYGVISNDPAFQKIIAGLQFFNAATQPGVDATTYQTYMTQASTLIKTALGDIQGLHAGVADNQNILKSSTTTQNNNITSLQSLISNFQRVDLTEVGTKISILQTQLEASFAATAALVKNSILKYL